MAKKRMFSMKIVDSGFFLELPLSSQCLYFHLNMRADDDGFIDNPKQIMRMIGASEDDIKLLLAKRFLLAFESGVMVVKHWRLHNTLQSDRYEPTTYITEKSQLHLDENRSYTRTETKCFQNVSIDKIRLGLDLDKDINNNICKTSKNFTPPTAEIVDEYVKKIGYHIDAEAFVAFYESKGWKVGNQPMKSWKAACTTWERKQKNTQGNVKNNSFHNFEQRSGDLDKDVVEKFDALL